MRRPTHPPPPGGSSQARLLGQPPWEQHPRERHPPLSSRRPRPRAFPRSLLHPNYHRLPPLSLTLPRGGLRRPRVLQLKMKRTTQPYDSQKDAATTPASNAGPKNASTMRRKTKGKGDGWMPTRPQTSKMWTPDRTRNVGLLGSPQYLTRVIPAQEKKQGLNPEAHLETGGKTITMNDIGQLPPPLP